MQTKDKIFDTIKEYDMIRPGDTVAVCLSGGADSMTLFHFMRLNREKLGIKVIALHVNHGLRRESRQEEIFVKSYCEKMGAECIVRRLDMNNSQKPVGMSTETWRRDLRYKFFFESVEKYNAKLATAHTLSDRAETMLFNIVRGSGLKGAGGIPPVRDNIIRPLINCTRGEIEEYCRENGIEFVTDMTNFSDVYSRNKIRLNVVPELKKINPAFENSMANFRRETGEIYTFLTQLSDNLYTMLSTANGLETAKLQRAPAAVVKNLIRNVLDDKGCLSKDNVEAVYQGIFKEKFTRQLTANLFCTVRNGCLNFEARDDKEKREVLPVKVEYGREIKFCGRKFMFLPVEPNEWKIFKENHKNHLTYCIGCDKIKGDLTLRTRQTGDVFTLQKRRVTKSLKKLFIEDKIPTAERDKIPVLSDESGRVLWLGGYGVNAGFAPGQEEKITAILQY